MASELVRSHVAVIFATGGDGPALAAKAATDRIPIVFLSGGDPVKAGLVPSLSRPGSHITGINIIFTELVPKLVELLHQLVPRATRIGALVNQNYPDVQLQRRELQNAAAVIKQGIHIVSAGDEHEIDTAFSSFVQQGIDALLVANDPFFLNRRDQIVALASRHTIPAIYSGRDYVAAGGLMSYGASLTEDYRQAGIYAGKILNGISPADLPILQPTTFELIVNLKTARALGLPVPQTLLLRADEVIQ